ncbi:MAG: U32 family peptidase [Bacteroidales bacterium]|nr:U32 family peptidase [Bacteroidales bacterium]
MKEIELLSPAKNLEVGIAAINHGADAVYIGGPDFGAREKVGNSIEDIEKLCRHAAIFDAKVYVTLNTLLFDNELEQARKMAWDCWNAGVDALIVQDMALLQMTDMPPVAFHASTQCHNISVEKVKFLEKVGFSQVVLARELSINEIKEIRSKTTVPLEFFVHGALCVSYSGQCYLSHVIGHRSANRGACAQPCRLAWNLEDENGHSLICNKHLLSLRDFNNFRNLEELIDAGITSFKIEGRLKDADYVKNTTAFYRREIDRIIERRSDLKRSSRGVSTPAFEPNLEKSFNRGFTDYFVHGRQKDIDAPYTPKSMGEYVGTIEQVNGNKLIISSDAEFHNGDGLCFLDRNNELQGFNVNGVEAAPQSFKRKENNLLITPSRLFKSIPPHVRLFRNFDIVWQKAVENSSGQRKDKISLRLVGREDGIELFVAHQYLENQEVSVSLPLVLSQANNPEKAMDTIRTKLSQWGDTKFVVENIEVDFSRPYFIPASALGELKRQLVVKLEDALVDRHRQNREIRQSLESEIEYPEKSLTYFGNVINSESRQFYENHGVGKISDGLEKTMPDGDVVVMTTKHCIRFSNGLCSKKIGKPASPLYICNDRGRFRLDFDCRNCRMKVVFENSKSSDNQ